MPRKARGGGRVELGLPGAAAEKNDHPQLRVCEAKGSGHRTQLLGALRNPAASTASYADGSIPARRAASSTE